MKAVFAGFVIYDIERESNQQHIGTKGLKETCHEG